MSLPTSASVLLCSDLHGCFGTFIRLLNAAPKGVQLVFLGDLEDRGPNSRAVIEMAMDKAIPTVLGNHESLLLAFYGRNARCVEMYENGVWLCNGGIETLRNWPVIDHRCSTPAEHQRANRDKYLGGRVPDTVLDWMEQLPAYLYPSTRTDENGRKLLCSHTGYGLAADKGDWFTALWGRHPDDGPFPNDNYYRVFGHSPRREAVVTDSWAMIDSGAAYTNRGFGVLSAFIWPTKQVLTQPFDETPVKQLFSLQDGVLF